MALAAAGLLVVPSARAEVHFDATCVQVNETRMAGFFKQWNDTLQTLNATKMAELYWPNAVLLATVSNAPRNTPALIEDYFTMFLKKKPYGMVNTRYFYPGCNTSIDLGVYTFGLMGYDGKYHDVVARYTYVYTYADGMWKIMHHHSSAMPEIEAAPTSAAPPRFPSPAVTHVLLLISILSSLLLL
eukprot:ANDGO_00229.mRNA.1 hypothetical protein THAPSDRAFT_264181